MTTVAAVDCGTNSTRLLVTDGARPIERMMRITRLGEGVHGRGVLAPAAIERTLEVLRDYRQMMDAQGVQACRATATSAARDAANRDELFGPASKILGVPLELLSGADEGRLSFAGATRELDPAAGPYLVVDIGGGSTELAVGPAGPDVVTAQPATSAVGPGTDGLGAESVPNRRQGEPAAVRSLDLGCVRLTEKHLHHDPPRAEELADALADVRDQLEDSVIAVPAFRDATTMIGLAGTVTTVAAVEQGLAVYERDRIHHFWLSRAAAEDVYRTLATEKRADRVFNPGLEEARADVIVGGCVALVAILRFFDLDGCLVSEDDILDGLAQSLLTRYQTA